jgi:hypothetical protein
MENLMNPARPRIPSAARTVLAAGVLASSAKSAPILDNSF